MIDKHSDEDDLRVRFAIEGVKFENMRILPKTYAEKYGKVYKYEMMGA